MTDTPPRQTVDQNCGGMLRPIFAFFAGSGGLGVLAIALPVWLIGQISFVVGPLLAGVLTWAVMRRALARGLLIAADVVGRCSYCGYDFAASGAKRCSECGCREQGRQSPHTP